MRRKGFFDKEKREKNFICTNFFLPFCCVTSGFILSRSQPPKPSRRRFTDDTRCERAEIFYHKLSFDEHSSLCRRHILLLAPTARLNVTRRETKAKKCEKHVSRALSSTIKRKFCMCTQTRLMVRQSKTLNRHSSYAVCEASSMLPGESRRNLNFLQGASRDDEQKHSNQPHHDSHIIIS